MQASGSPLQAAIERHRSQLHDPVETRESLGRISADFNVPRSTLAYRVKGQTAPARAAHEYRQSLSKSEE